MDIHGIYGMTNPDRLRRLAKRIKNGCQRGEPFAYELFLQCGTHMVPPEDVRLTQCYHMVARYFGFKKWSEIIHDEVDDNDVQSLLDELHDKI